MSFDLALSGINAANTDLNVTSNNLANVDTTGFKESRAEFADLFAQTQGGVAQTAVGNGVQVAEIAQQFGNGNTTNTGNNLDLALSGSGFFIVSDNGALNYTRDGAFQVDQNGYLVTASGEQVQGYAPLTNGGFNTGGLTSIQLNTAESAPQATTTAGVALNLPSNATAPTNTPLNPADPTTYTDTTSMTVYDSLGAAHTAQLYFLKGATANNWTTQLYVDGTAVGTGQALTFSNTGVLTTPANGQVNFGAYTPTTGAAAMNITSRRTATPRAASRASASARPGWCRRTSPMASRRTSARSPSPTSPIPRGCNRRATTSGSRPSIPAMRCTALPAAPGSRRSSPESSRARTSTSRPSSST
jgi:flagellar hook protein FlgE